MIRDSQNSVSLSILTKLCNDVASLKNLVIQQYINCIADALYALGLGVWYLYSFIFN
jgi:hypothetical protein